MHYIYIYVQSCGQIDRAKQNRIEYFTADFLQDFAENVISWLLGGRLSTCHQIQAFQGFSCNFLNSQIFSRLAKQFSHSLSGDKTQRLVPISCLTLKCTFIYLFITSFNVGTLKKVIADKNQSLNIITKKIKTVIIITKMHAYDCNVTFMFGI